MNFAETYLTAAEVALVQWQFGLHGSFFSHLWRAIASADHRNSARLSLGFPAEVAAYEAFSRVSGYWENVQVRANLLPVGSTAHAEAFATGRYYNDIAKQSSAGIAALCANAFTEDSNEVHNDAPDLVMFGDDARIVSRWRKLDEDRNGYVRIE